ncbi:hypothetical protein HDV57DRAFT_492114 [Trichoderma longibrachiatum]
MWSKYRVLAAVPSAALASNYLLPSCKCLGGFIRAASCRLFPLGSWVGCGRACMYLFGTSRLLPLLPHLTTPPQSGRLLY